MYSKKFYCPHCGGNLNPNNKVITKAIKTDTNEQGLVLQNEEYGNYNYLTGEKFSIQPGDKLRHHCPLCNSSLESKTHQNCSMLIVEDAKRRGTITFASDGGSQATFIKWESGETESFGKDQKSIFPGFDLHELNYEDQNVGRMQ